MTTGNQLAQQHLRSTTVCVIGPLLPSRAPTTNPSPLRPAFLIANGILEFALTLSKQTIAMPSNREKFSGPRINKSAWEVTFASEAKKRLIATLANSKVRLVHSQQRLLKFSNRNKNRVFALALLHESSICPEPAEQVTNHESLGPSIPVECTARAEQLSQVKQFEGDITEN